MRVHKEKGRFSAFGDNKIQIALTLPEGRPTRSHVHCRPGASASSCGRARRRAVCCGRAVCGLVTHLFVRLLLRAFADDVDVGGGAVREKVSREVGVAAVQRFRQRGAAERILFEHARVGVPVREHRLQAGESATGAHSGKDAGRNGERRADSGGSPRFAHSAARDKRVRPRARRAQPSDHSPLRRPPGRSAPPSAAPCCPRHCA